MTATMYQPVIRPHARVVIHSAPAGWPELAGRRASASECARVIPLAPVRRPRGSRRLSAAPPRPLACAASAAPSVHGGGLTRRGRMVVAFVWLLLGVAVVFAFVRPWGGAEEVPSVVTVRVEAGDTLWGLAGDLAPAADRREMVATILELNSLGSAGEVQAGDTLLIPAPAG